METPKAFWADCGCPISGSDPGFCLKHYAPLDLTRFASEMAQILWDAEGGDLDNEGVQSLLVSCGIVRYRKPTEAELNDREWWGHEWEIGPDDEGVGEFTAGMKELRDVDGGPLTASIAPALSTSN